MPIASRSPSRPDLFQAFIFIIFLTIALPLTAGTVEHTYRGIRPTDPEGRLGLRNPERGFRWENRFGSFEERWQSHRWIDTIHTFAAEDGLTVTQAYCELIAYHDQPQIPEEQIQRLREDFQAVRAAGLKLMLCFRYEMNRELNQGPTLAILLQHIAQLRPLLQENMDVIAVFQTGFIGLYGEWHRSVHGLDRDEAAQEEIVQALLDLLPEDRRMVMRYPRHKNAFIRRTSGRTDYAPLTLAEAHTAAPIARIGFCNHGFMVGENDAGTFPPRPSDIYDYMTQESLFVPMEGEYFWAFSTHGQLKDDGLEAIRRYWEHHFDLFSYTHNHSRYEGWRWKEERGARYTIDEWKEDLLPPGFLAEHGIPVADGYFEDDQGHPVERSIFEYVRDHLGYRLELQSARFPQAVTAGQRLKAETRFVNRGFAAPMNPRHVHYVLIDEHGTVTELPRLETDAQRWYPCDPIDRSQLAPLHTWTLDTALPEDLAPGTYRLGLWLPDPAPSLRYDLRYAIRLANGDAPWWTSDDGCYGVQILGRLRIEAAGAMP